MIVVLLDTAGAALPEGLEFLHPGWWLLHVLAVVFVYYYGYRRGRGDERREQRAREIEGKKKGPESPSGR